MQTEYVIIGQPQGGAKRGLVLEENICAKAVLYNWATYISTNGQSVCRQGPFSCLHSSVDLFIERIIVFYHICTPDTTKSCIHLYSSRIPVSWQIEDGLSEQKKV